MQSWRHTILAVGTVLLGFMLLAGSQSVSAAEMPAIPSSMPAALAQTATSPGPTAVPLPCGASQVVTNADNGRIYFLPVGSRFLLHLDASHTWTVQVSDPDILTEVCTVNQGVYAAHTPGRTTLTAIGYPLCATAGCLQAVVLFQITVNVGFYPSPTTVTTSATSP